jgi:CRISPR-associated endoribonuclease Cas6
LKATFNDEPSSVLKISFDTPAAFKSRNDYVIVPDLHLVFQSLMKKATAATSDDSFFDEETLDALVQNSKIISYNLRTVKFSLEGRRITGFTGYISIYIKGPSLLKNFAKTLFRFGEYLGVGIKASIGMGALSIKEDEK